MRPNKKIDRHSELFRRGEAYGERMMDIFDGKYAASPLRRSFISGVYFAVFLREKSKRLPERQQKPTTKLMLEKHDALIKALTENNNLREEVGRLKRRLERGQK